MASRRQKFSITIPPEIITEILYRLPAKSIGRFRCVSKSWLSQLTHPKIIKINLNNTFSHQNHIILTSTYSQQGSPFLYSHPLHSREVVTKPTKFDLQLNFSLHCVDVCGSCDGLVLFRALDSSKTMVVINPTTKEFLHLPKQKKYDVYDHMGNLYEHIGNMYGFGYDSVTDDYKVVSLTHYCYVDDDNGDCNDKVYADVYSLRNKKWRRVTDSPYGYLITSSWGLYGVFFNGFIHWIVSTETDDLIGIVAFGLADERFSKIPFPRFCNTLKSNDCELLVLCGKLAIFIKSEGVVWLMNEYGVTKSWTEVLLHGIDKVPICKPKRYTRPRVLDDNGKILVANSNRMMVYEVEKATFTETVCVWNPEKFCIAGFYLESLVSPKLGKEEEEDKDDNAEDENEEGEVQADDDAENENEEDDENVEREEENDVYDVWKAKHQAEKLEGDKIEEELTHALSKQQLLTDRLEAKLVKMQALERRTMEQDDEIESLKARLTLAEEERTKAIAALSQMAKSTLN